MALTIGKAPFTHPPAGKYNFDFARVLPDHVLYLDRIPKRVRGILNGKTIVDTMRAKMVFETGEFIQWYFPIDDVAADALERSSTRRSDEFKGEAAFYNVRAGETIKKDAAWDHPAPPHEASFMNGLIAFDFDAIDAWFEEDDQVFGHPRDPYHRFDVRHTSEHVRVEVAGIVVAETRRAIKLFETSLITRYYVPPEDVSRGALIGSVTRTYCPYKGEATYFHVKVGDELIEDAAWTLRQPMGEADVIRDYLSFWKERTKIYADGRAVAV